MLIAPNLDFTAHAVSVNAPTLEYPNDFHRLSGVQRRIRRNPPGCDRARGRRGMHAAIQNLTYLGVVENNFHSDSVPGCHEAVFLYIGIIDPAPAEVAMTYIRIPQCEECPV